jgi:hypothetical protein
MEEKRNKQWEFYDRVWPESPSSSTLRTQFSGQKTKAWLK